MARIALTFYVSLALLSSARSDAFVSDMLPGYIVVGAGD